MTRAAAAAESFGHLDWVSGDARDELFDAQCDLLGRTLGAPAG